MSMRRTSIDLANRLDKQAISEIFHKGAVFGHQHPSSGQSRESYNMVIVRRAKASFMNHGLLSGHDVFPLQESITAAIEFNEQPTCISILRQLGRQLPAVDQNTPAGQPRPNGSGECRLDCSKDPVGLIGVNDQTHL